jgi:hypothetical protein
VNTGPFGNGGSPGEECIGVPRGMVLSYGFEAFSNSGPAAVIERASLADPHGGSSRRVAYINSAPASTMSQLLAHAGQLT